MSLSFRVTATVARPIEEVFDHVVEPALLDSYFTSTASAALAPGRTVRWAWASGQSETVTVDTVERPRTIVFRWRAHLRPEITTVRMTLETVEPLLTGDADGTRVTIAEEGWAEGDPAALASAFEHCAGWQHMLMCMRARMTFGIDLRS
jgi:uncharacterized protein YndB with AHSA1/START domain